MGNNHRIAVVSGALGLLLAGVLGGAGCNGASSTTGFDEAVASGERPVSMRGHALFFGGSLDAVVTLSRGVGLGSKGRRIKPPDPNDIMNSEDDRNNAVSYLIARGNLGSPMAPITIHLKLENRTDQVMKVQIAEFNSDLGNFAVTPDSLILNGGQVGEPEPMISQLGVTSDSIPFKVTLTLSGKTETATVVARDVPPPPAAPAK
jgi:hypothetical protein